MFLLFCVALASSSNTGKSQSSSPAPKKVSKKGVRRGLSPAFNCIMPGLALLGVDLTVL
jgi:hypothetical protein